MTDPSRMKSNPCRTTSGTRNSTSNAAIAPMTDRAEPRTVNPANGISHAPFKLMSCNRRTLTASEGISSARDNTPCMASNTPISDIVASAPNAVSAMPVISMGHQNSLREARPEKTA